MEKKYDIAIIGGGPGGYVAALHAAELGKKVAIIEADLLGGTCLNRGCIPSKTLLRQAEIIESIEQARNWGIETGEVILSLDRMKKRVAEVITRLRNGIHFLMKQGKIDVYQGYGMMDGSHQIKISNGDQQEFIQSNKVIIATGSTPVVPPIPGLDSVSFHTSDSIFEIKSIPDSITIIGGGVIGVELASIFASLKSKVTIIEMAESIVPSEDIEASKILEKELKKKGVHILTSTRVERVQENGPNIHVFCKDKNGNELLIDTNSLSISVGRKPNVTAVSNLNLEFEGPYIKVNEKMETSLADVYAVGDVVGGFQLAHVASAEGIVAAKNAAGEVDVIDYHVVPRCIYTFPEIASVGMTESEARDKGMEISIERFDHHANGKAIALGEIAGFTKIIYEEKYGEILGVTMVGPHVTEMISEAASFMYLEGTIEEAAKMIHPHPTVSETFYEAAFKAVGKRKNRVVV